ncbi:hypothetical protein [Acidicapsa acidisoli]|uniref:hypothetical protein n=1 Tax=Acidicapsa acidisoli TaxID=1615681 RepID=UPI0021E07298|nr:hypothetical protein [Acidicapsa acidisoli]
MSPAQSAAQPAAQSAARSLPPEELTMLNLQVGWDDAVPSAQNPSGLRMSFTLIDTDAFVSYNLVHHVARYRAFAPGAPADQVYSLSSWKIGSEVQTIYDQVYVNAKGLLMLHKPRPDQQDKDAVDSQDEIELSLEAARGEPVRYVLTTADGKLLVPGTVVPYPIESKDGNCRLEARLGMPDAEAVLIYVDGLAPKADVPFQEISEGESHASIFHTNPRGHAAAVDLPFVVSKAAGILKVSVATKGCTATVEIPWGKDSYHAQ